MKHLFIGIATKCCFLIAMFMLIQLYGNAQFLITPPSTQTGTTSAGAITVHGTTGTGTGAGVYVGHGNSNILDCTAFGTGVLATATSGNNNTAIGYRGLFSLTSGAGNTAIGATALTATTTAQNNSALGNGALQSNTTGNNNTGIGALALIFNTNGTDNTALGSNAAVNLTSGSFYNTFIGANSGFNSSVTATMTASDNCVLGFSSLNSLINGDRNIALGSNTMNNLQYGTNNVAIGYQANVGTGTIGAQIVNTLSIQNVIYGQNMGSLGSGNIGIGTIPATTGASGTVYSKLHVAGTSTSSPSLQLDFAPTVTSLPVTNPTGTGKYLFLDAYGVVSQAPVPTGVTNCGTANYIPVTTNTNGDMVCSQVYDNGSSSGVGIGTNTGFTYTGTTITGQIGPAPTSGSVFKLVVNGTASGTAFIALSDQRLKKEIKRIESPLAKISKINGYTYIWNKEYSKTRQLDDNKQAGFLAQEILKVLPEAVIKSEDGLYGLNYNAIMPLLAEGIKEQQSQIEKQQIKIEDLEAKVKELSNKLDRLVPGEVKIKEANFDITPNPITGVSTVSYKLDNSNTNAYLAVYDLQGKLLKQIGLAKNTSEGQVQIRKTDFTNGMYILALISNNTEIQSKRFIISQ